MSRGRPFQSAALLRKEDAARIFCRNIWEQLGRNGIYGEICWLGEQDMVHNEALALFLQVQPSLGCAEEGFTAALPYQPDIKSFARASRCPVIEIVQPFFVSTSATPSVTSSHVDIPAAIRSCPPAISTSGLGSSTSDMMLNQFCFIVQMALVLWCSLVQHNSDCLCGRSRLGIWRSARSCLVQQRICGVPRKSRIYQNDAATGAFTACGCDVQVVCLRWLGTILYHISIILFQQIPPFRVHQT
ncbi:uncharacterized protein LOC144113445 isoform X1 [Amblyomma americanum]